MILTRLRVVLPEGAALTVFALIYLLLEAPYAYLEWRVGRPLDVPRPGMLVARLAALAYGGWRALAFHPAYRGDYRIWLERGPWTSRKPLPAGPIALSWEDALPAGALALMAAFHGPSGPFIVLGLFLIGHQAIVAVASFTTGATPFGYAVAFLIGLSIRLWPEPRDFLAAAVAGYLVGWAGLRVSLAKFPWPGYRKAGANDPKQAIREAACGWPFDQLQPKARSGRILPAHAGVLISLLAGWYLFAAESFFPDPAARRLFLHLGFVNAILILAFGRASLYGLGYAPPISLWGRLRTSRWIVPGHDQVYLAPLCTILVGVLALDRFRPPGLVDDTFLPIALAVACLVALTTGPSLARWRLTGRHRITLGVSKKGGEFVKVG